MSIDPHEPLVLNEFLVAFSLPGRGGSAASRKLTTVRAATQDRARRLIRDRHPDCLMVDVLGRTVVRHPEQ